MSEADFRKQLKEQLEKRMKNYCFQENFNLIYKVILDEKLAYQPKDSKNPKRGHYAFQTDIAILKHNLPLVVMETKYGSFSSHDVLIYSTKALRHKELYPYLRYGFVVGGKEKIEHKFFTHNVGFDFAIALKDLKGKNLDRLQFILETQLKSAKLLLDLFVKKKKVTEFHSAIHIKE